MAAHGHVPGVQVSEPGAAASRIRPRTGSSTEVEIGDAGPTAYRVKGTRPGGEGRVPVESFTDLTGTVLRTGPVGSGTTEVRRTDS